MNGAKLLPLFKKNCKWSAEALIGKYHKGIIPYRARVYLTDIAWLNVDGVVHGYCMALMSME
jgi:hypothetical protein